MSNMKSMKIKRYGWRRKFVNTSETEMHEYATKEERDSAPQADEFDWTKYNVTRTIKSADKPFWWAIKQLQAGKSVRAYDGTVYNSLFTLLTDVESDDEDLVGWAQSWTLIKEES